MTAFLTNEALHQKTSQELTSLLYEACLTNLENACIFIDKKEFVLANEKLQKAIDILHRLGAGINYEAGIVADQLEQIYNYMVDRLVEANFKKDKSLVNEIIQLLTKIMTSWNQGMKTKQSLRYRAIKQKANAYERTAIYE